MTHIASSDSVSATRSSVSMIGRAALWFTALSITVIFTAVISSHFTREDNFFLARKTQQLAQVDRFATSGQQVDISLREFDDALSDRKRIDSSREKLRAAIAEHASDAVAYKSVLGEQRTKQYLHHLATFRDMTDSATAATNAVPMAQFGLQVSIERRALVQQVRQNLMLEATKKSWFWRLVSFD